MRTRVLAISIAILLAGAATVVAIERLRHTPTASRPEPAATRSWPLGSFGHPFGNSIGDIRVAEGFLWLNAHGFAKVGLDGKSFMKFRRYIDKFAFADGWLWARSGYDFVRMDPVSQRVLATFHRPGIFPSAIAAGLGSGWFSEWAKGEVFRLDSAMRITRRYPIRGRIIDLQVAGGMLWAAIDRGGVVMRLNPETGEWTRAFEMDDRKSGAALHVSDGFLWIDVTRSDETHVLVRLDPYTGDRDQVALGKNQFFVGIADGSAWVAAGEDVLRLDPRTLRLVGKRHSGRVVVAAVSSHALWTVSWSAQELGFGMLMTLTRIPN